MQHFSKGKKIWIIQHLASHTRSSLLLHGREVCCLPGNCEKTRRKESSETSRSTSGNRGNLLMSVLKGAEIIIHFGNWEQLNIFSIIIMLLQVPSVMFLSCAVGRNDNSDLQYFTMNVKWFAQSCISDKNSKSCKKRTQVKMTTTVVTSKVEQLRN